MVGSKPNDNHKNDHYDSDDDDDDDDDDDGGQHRDDNTSPAALLRAVSLSSKLALLDASNCHAVPSSHNL